MGDSVDARRPEIWDIAGWILQEGLQGTQFDVLIETLCKRLVDAGMPLLRANFSMRAHHPEIGAFAYRWKRKEGLLHEEYSRDVTVSTGWDQSPLKTLVDGNDPEFRQRLSKEHEPFAYPLFDELVQEQGATDYFATQLVFSDDGTWTPANQERYTVGLLVSWTSDAPDGFEDRDLDDIRFLIPVLGLALKSNSNYKMAQDLLSAYLGGDAGARVLSGDIARGSLQNIEAVILYLDLAGFTKLSEALPGNEVIDLLNDYFGAMVPLIEKRGGNVLKFMGDGLLAIFAKDDVPAAELAAIKTIRQIEAAFVEINERRAADDLHCTGFTAAAHAGDVLYGNIGAPNRLDFTVIGPAVNTAARISAMTAHVDQPIVIGANVARPLLSLRDDLVSLGTYRLRGVSERQELFTLD